jgi:DNA polymerase-3 subunit delta
MRINADNLARQLEQDLAHAWLVAGEEPLLVGEAADAIRGRARELGYTEREVHFVEARFDWSGLEGASRALSLFAERRILEIRLPTARPGSEGGKALATMAADPPPDTLVLVTTGRLEREAYSSAWYRAFEQHGVVVQAWPVDIGRLPGWIRGRARRHGIAVDEEGARLLAERVEGNLLAAHQEIEKLALLHGDGEVGAEVVASVVANSARYDVFQLGEAALAGDAARALRILEGLRSEGAEPTLVLWVLCREIRALAEARGGDSRGGHGKQAQRRAQLLAAATRRMAGRRLGPLVHRAERADRSIKGLLHGEAWDELAALAASLAGLVVPEAASA